MVKSGLCHRQLEIHHVLSGGQDYWPAVGREWSCSGFGFYELDYCKALFSDWFMEMYCTLEIAHKLLVATATLKIVKLLFCAFCLVT